VKKKDYKLYHYKQIMKITCTWAKDTSINFKKKGLQACEETKKRLKRRAKAKVLEYALCNDWQYFFTQTIDGSRWDRSASDTINKIKRTLQQANIKYLLCVDRHKDGALHLHGLINVSKDRLINSGVTALNKTTKQKQPVFNLLTTQKYGFNSCFEIITNSIEDKIKIAYYVASYITKDDNSSFNHRYFASNGLETKTQIPINQNDIVDYIEKNGLIPDYKNDYTSIYTLLPYELDYISKTAQNQYQIMTKLRNMFGNIVKVE
jgi:predicted Zn-ribbon and HTH transcriptional regulator